jgi:subtilase family serine protease
VHFRWRNARGKLVRSEQAISPVCRQPDNRPDLLVRDLSIEPGGRYVAVIFNRGRQPAAAFSVDFLRDGAPLGTAEVAGLAPRETFTVILPAMPCSPWERIEAVADARSQIDESDEENDALSVFC